VWVAHVFFRSVAFPLMDLPSFRGHSLSMVRTISAIAVPDATNAPRAHEEALEDKRQPDQRGSLPSDPRPADVQP